MNDPLIFGKTTHGPDIRLELSHLTDCYRLAWSYHYFGVPISEMTRDEMLGMIIHLHDRTMGKHPAALS